MDRSGKDRLRLYGDSMLSASGATPSSETAGNGLGVGQENGIHGFMENHRPPPQGHLEAGYYGLYQFGGFMPGGMPVFSDALPPPPGLPSPSCTGGAPPGFYYPPQQPPSHIYGLYGGQSVSQVYSPVMPAQHQHQQQQQQQQQLQQQQQAANAYSHFQFMSTTPPPASPLRREIMDGMDGRVGMTSNNGDVVQPNGSCSVMGTAGLVGKKQRVIDPMIENIVGSMSMSTNGTYTPFGPSVSIAPSGLTGGGGGGCGGHFGESENGMVGQQQGSSPLMSSVVAGPQNGGGAVGKEKIGIVRPRVISQEAQVVSTEANVLQQQQRAGTPKDGSDSRPQTPGKLSYSEVLTRNEPKGLHGTVQKVPSAPASNSPSPGPGNQNSLPATRRTSITSSFQQHADSTANATSTRDAFHSNSSSSSSSPVTKPKVTSNNSNNTFETVTTKVNRNKENNSSSSTTSSSSSSNKSSTRNTPAATPTHSNGGVGGGPKSGGGNGGKTERKVLNVSNSQTSGNGTKCSKSTTSAPGKTVKNFPFEFDIEDLDEIEDKLKSDLSGKSTKRDSVSGGSSSSKNPSVGVNNGGNLSEKKTAAVAAAPQNGKGRGGRDKSERQQRNRKGGRNCVVRRVQQLSAVWVLHLISALNWLWSLVLNVSTLSCSLALTLLEDGYNWWRVNAVPSCRQQLRGIRGKILNLWTTVKSWKLTYFWRKGVKGDGGEDRKDGSGKFKGGAAGGGRVGGKNGLPDILAMMGPEKNITLPVNGDEALKRLMSVKGQDPYSILGIRSDSSDETIRRYYKKQAVLVHPDKNMVPGAEEAFKILARAFELIGEPAKRFDYHRQLLEAHQKEIVFGEIGNLLEQLRKKIESVSNSIRCTKCNSRHKKNRTDRPLFAARYCGQCRINHGAREGDLWAERKGWFGLSRSYFACMESSIWEVNEWASCQKKNLKHLIPDCHNIMYRLVAGGGGGSGSGPGTGGTSPPGCGPGSSSGGGAGGCAGNNISNGHAGKSGKVPSPGCNHHYHHNHGGSNPPGWDDFGGPTHSSREESTEPEIDEWDTLINNLVRTPNVPGTSSHHHHPKNTHVNSSSNPGYSGSFSSSKFSGLAGGVGGLGSATSTGPPTTATAGVGVNPNPARRRGKVKRK